jgi:hypothetical protein
VLEALTTERARELAEAARARERRLNNAFVQELAARVRRLVREARQQGMGVLILIDPINPDSLRGTSLQGTLLRARRKPLRGSSARDRGGCEPRQRVDPMTPRAPSNTGAVRGAPTKRWRAL